MNNFLNYMLKEKSLFSKKVNSIFSLILFFFFFLFVSDTIADSIPMAQSMPSIRVSKPQLDPSRVKKRIVAPKPLGLVEPSRVSHKDTLATYKPTTKDEGIKFMLKGVEISGVTAYKESELREYYFPYLNKNVSFGDLQAIASNITTRYRNDGYAISRAIIPEQEVENGIVEIEVVEGYIDQVYIEGGSKKTNSRIKKYAEKIKKMRPLQINTLERYVLILNDIPGLEVKTVLSPSGGTLKAADLTFVVIQDRVALNAYYDNRGTRYLGPAQLVVMGSLNSIFMAADEFVLQTIDTPWHDELRYLQLKYSLPIGIDGFRFKADGSITRTIPGFTIEDLSLVGRSRNFSCSFEYPLYRSRSKNLWLNGEFEYLNTYTQVDSYVWFKDQIRSLRLGFSYDFVDGWLGANLIDLKLSKGLPIFGASPVGASIGLSRYKGLSNYTKINLDVSRYQAIGQRWILLGSVGGQYSFGGRLLSAEEYGFGGSQFGRAYDSSELLGDSGVISKLELRLNTYPDKKFLQQIQYYTFSEFGILWNVGGDTFEQPAKDTGFDIGCGIRATINSYFYGNMEIAKPLTRGVNTQRESGKNGNAWRLFFGIGLRV